MTSDKDNAEIEAAVEAMRAVRTVGARVHDDVLRAYARAALEAGRRVLMERVRKRTQVRQQHQGDGNPLPG